ncbi:hypothetical protein LRAMOSA02980 [Lichtheimia ramosa]|uniref:Stc1 domain-containing protein n=1 Tax=Lichtheimia ramosa TaxID=688394 RepID=A0A077WSR7_9FUNG|nr:hypothetical protein LRAMOSA02980 [Lichtheimia ramosa]
MATTAPPTKTRYRSPRLRYKPSHNTRTPPSHLTLKCGFCKEFKALTDFTDEQRLKSLRHKFHSAAICMACTTPPEDAFITCTLCHKTKPRHCYSRRQRRVFGLNDARCQRCVQKYQEGPALQESDSDDSSDEDFSDDGMP